MYIHKQATTCTMYFRHMCVLPNHQFYFYILTVSSGLLCIYILCNLYNLVKLTICIWTKLCVSLFTSVLDCLASDGSDVPGHQKISG